MYINLANRGKNGIIFFLLKNITESNDIHYIGSAIKYGHTHIAINHLQNHSRPWNIFDHPENEDKDIDLMVPHD